MSVNITPQMRVEQYPDEFKVHRGRLWCIWCDRLINHNRKDLMNEHLWSKIHQDNRVANGAKISYDIDSKEACERRRRRRKKAARSMRRKKERDARNSIVTEAFSIDSSGSSEDNSTDLRKLFEDSDSDSTTSFEGFDSPPNVLQEKQSRNRSASLLSTDDDSRKSGRSRKRPARLDDSIDHEEIAKIGKIADQAAFVSSMTRRRKTTEEYSSPSSPDHSPLPPLRIRSMPIKKQISYSARQSDSTSPTSPIRESLKMKFSRSTDKASPEYHVKPNFKVSETESGKGIKLKFTWKNKNYGGTEKLGAKTTDEDADNLSGDGEPVGYKQMLKGIEDTISTVEETNDVEEVIEEEIVEMHEEEVVGEEDWVHPEGMIETSKNGTEIEQNINADTKNSTMSSAASMSVKTAVKSTVKAQAKSKKVTKATVTDVKKRKMTGYMLWTKHTRPKVAKQYPGLEFGDVSKKLGDLWKRMPDKEKQMWKFRTEKFENQSQQSQATFRKSGSRMIETGPKKKAPPAKQQMIPSSPPVKNPEAAMNFELKRFPPPTTEPIDSAAYLSLLGESFAKLSAKTKKVESKVVIQGAESILLDSLVCALAPLISLTRQIPELEGALDQKSLTNTFSNIAHIMPGL